MNPPPPPQSRFDWETEIGCIEALAADTAEAILERSRASSALVSTSTLDHKVKTSIQSIKSKLQQLEQQLSAAEETGQWSKDELKRWEEAVLAQSRECDKLEALAGESSERMQLLSMPEPPAGGSSSRSKVTRFAEPLVIEDAYDASNSEMVQLQQRIMQDQDSHLDLLSESILRQKDIGIMISDELNMHVQLLEETEQSVDNQNRNLRQAQRRLNEFVASTPASTKGYMVIAALLIILVIVILARRT
ncbi:uncharacterized protein BJ171DRAFT_501696 [Polychytrium aggregatum]|uniref:uncharacterized protein n=1 Tax=Polychytrium aggregatum TaxID=110093 RepID=UPI0022FE0281|nr:uncharacterized protein BJ171DRAFT_501696 [Polychytrium aggregatum]KAI9205287.1 hypothetical protein BJ171DRAFT_501696 [Polychytrium aggregatum]